MNTTEPKSQYAQLVTIADSGNEASEIESFLREAGLPVRMTLLQLSDELGEQLRQIKPDLVFCDQRILEKQDDCLHLCIRALPYTPVLLLGDTVDIATSTRALWQRARDVVSTRHMDHLHAVYLRELSVSRLQKQLVDTRSEVEALEQRLEAMVDASESAVVQLQDGIIVEANPSFARLFELDSENQAMGLPFLDFVHSKDQKTVKRQVSRCAKGRKIDSHLHFRAITPNGGEVDADLELKLVQFEGEPAVEAHLSSQGTAEALPHPAPVAERETTGGQKSVKPAPAPAPPRPAPPRKKPKEDPRVSFYKSLEDPKHYPPHGKGHSLAYIIVDNSDKIKQDLGLAAADQFMGRIFTFISKQLPGAKVYRLAIDEFALLAPGRLFKHGESLARNFSRQISEEIFDFAGTSVVLTISVALTLVDEAKHCGACFTEVRELARELSKKGGNDIAVCASASQAEQTEEPIEWQDLKEAIGENRIRLASRPIASLEGDNRHYYEIHPRIPDETGKLIAIENGGPQDTNREMQMALDYKVMQLSLGMLKRFANSNQRSAVFTPISSCSLEQAEKTVDWLLNEYASLRLKDQYIILSLSESVLTPHIHRLRDLISKLEGQPVRFAINDCAGNEQSLRLVQHLPAHFLRLTAQSTQALCDPKSLKSENLHEAVSIAREHGYKIIAATTGDAHSMAVLWQLGVNYVESGEVQEPAAA